MPINKITPRQLSPDVDSKLVPSTSFLDALNIHTGDHEQGNEGVIKNIKGNSLISTYVDPDDAGDTTEALPDDARLIGKVEDTRTGIVYLFVFSETATDQGIWGYDPYNKLDGSVEGGNLRLIYKSAQFGFKPNGFVKANIVYTNASRTFTNLGEEFEKDAIIYFTDGVNEPRKINAYRAFNAKSNIHGALAPKAEADFICACPKTPLKPITFLFESDTSRLTNNFIGTQGFQFAYQHIYVDGMETAVSPYSDIAFPPSVLEQGANTYVDHNEYNACRLSIPPSGPEISEVRLLCRQGNTGSFQVMDQIDAQNTTIEYLFYNDRILTGFSDREINKQFDGVPRRATAQTVSSNRLFYGNYLDGFDNERITDAIVEVNYFPREEEFKSFNVKLQPSIAPHGYGKTAAFVVDCSDLQDEITTGTVVDVKVTLAPDRNWHIYNFPSQELSYHQSTQLGPQDQESVDTVYSGANRQTFFSQTPEEAGSGYLYPNYPVFGSGTGVTAPTGLSWKEQTQGTNFTNVTYGTSAGNPLILQGGGVTFSTKLEAGQDISNGRQAIASAIKIAFAFEDVDNIANGDPDALATLRGVALGNLGFLEVESVFEPEYSFDVGLTDGQLITQGFMFQDDPSPDKSRLISLVRKSNSTATPLGAFIVNKGTVKMKAFVADETYIYNNPLRAHIGFTIKSLTNLDFFTCIHETPNITSSEGYTFNPANLGALSWVAIHQDTISDFEFNLDDFLSSKGYSFPNGFHNPNSGQNGASGTSNFINQVGYFAYVDEADFFVEGANHCLMDGEGGPGGSASRGGADSTNPYDLAFLYEHGSVTVNPIELGGYYSYVGTAFFGGTIGVYNYAGSGDGTIPGGPSSTTPTQLPLIIASGNGSGIYPNPEQNPIDEDFITLDSVNFKRLHPYVEIIAGFTSIQPEGGGTYRSFKTDATHDFGVVYYDQRGRHGFVNPIPSAYVKGYGDRPTGNEGRAEVKITFGHEPPPWAHNYKIVYAKNTTVKDFIQYSAGGAFIARDEEEQSIQEGNTNIYVSLNYLQGHPISYVSSFGARTPIGGINFYKFEEGDKLRVISYDDGGQREYPKGVEFEVVGQVILGGTENPLSLEPESNQQGEFVILKNNPNAGRFTFSDVAGGTDAWGNNCIFELRSPYKTREEDTRFYYEVSDTFDVVFNPTTQLREHGSNPITLNKGDVFFRKVAVNARDKDGGTFPDIIRDDDGEADPSKSNFKSVYLETNTATDLYRSDSIGIGRPNLIREEARETIRESAIVYSDISNPEANKLKYSSFNYTDPNTKNLPEKYNSIQYLGDEGQYIYCIQEDRLSKIPVDRNILSDASGTQSLISSKQVLGDAIFFAGQSGCAKDPSSVVDNDGNVYFANQSIGTVYRYSKNSLENISDKGASSFFRNLFKDARNGLEEGQVLRVVGGFDPVKKEYLLTTVGVSSTEATGIETIGLGFDTVTPGGDPGGGGGTGGGEGGVTGVVEIDNFNILSNYDLIFQLVQNGATGFTVPPSNPEIDAQITNGELLEVASVLGLAGPATTFQALSGDLNLDGIVGTSDLLILLSSFSIPLDFTGVDPDVIVFETDEEADGGVD